MSPATTGTRAARRAPTRAQGRHRRRHRALITGATSGIGLAVARDLARDHDLILLARTATDVEDLATALREETGAVVSTLAVDLIDDAALAQVIADADLGSRGLDAVIHCAGTEYVGRLEHTDPAAWRRVLDLNLVAVAHLTSLTLPALRATRGLVVLINSGAGLRTWPGQALYSASKHGLRALADTLRQEERGQVRVTTIYPGRVDTPMQRRLQKQAGNRYRPKDHMSAASVAAAVRLAVDTPLDACVEDLSIRPADMP